MNIIFKSHYPDERKLYELYVKNQIIRNYQIIEYDSLNRKYVFLEKPVKRPFPLEKFSYYSISGKTKVYYHPSYKLRHRDDYLAYESFFKNLIVYSNYDSAQIVISNNNQNFRLMFYLQNDSLIFFENNYTEP